MDPAQKLAELHRIPKPDLPVRGHEPPRALHFLQGERQYQGPDFHVHSGDNVEEGNQSKVEPTRGYYRVTCFSASSANADSF